MSFFFGFPFDTITMSPEKLAEQRRRNAEAMEKRLASAVPWTPTMAFSPGLAIKADTYHPYHLFNVKPTTNVNPNNIKADDEKVIFGEWIYSEKILPRGRCLDIFSGSKKGTVVFDGDVVIPAIHKRHNTVHEWDDMPYMSLTPMEMMTLRPGTKLAKGEVVIGGLGLGYQLVEVSKRKQVKKITLIELDQSIVDNVLPRLLPMLDHPVDEVIVGNVYDVMPTLKADVALVDVFKTYGNNEYKRYRLREACKNIGNIWCWGTAKVGREDRW